MVVIDGLVAVDFHKVVFGSQVTVEVICRYFDRFVFRKTASRIFHDRKDFWKYLFQYHFHLFSDILFDLVNFCPDRFTFFQFLVVDAFAQFFHFSAFIGYVILDTLFDFISFCTKLVIRELLDWRIYGLDLVHIRGDFFQVTLRLIAEQLRHKFIKSHNLLNWQLTIDNWQCNWRFQLDGY